MLNHFTPSIPDDLKPIIELMASQLGIRQDSLPPTLSPAQTGQILDTSVNTLAVWRSTGRYRLPFIKIGSRVRYPLIGTAEFLKSRTFFNTGEVSIAGGADNGS